MAPVAAGTKLPAEETVDLECEAEEESDEESSVHVLIREMRRVTGRAIYTRDRWL